MERFKIRAFAVVPGHIAVFASEKIQDFLDESYPDIESFVRPIVASNRIEVVLSFEADDFVAAEKMGNLVLGGVFSLPSRLLVNKSTNPVGCSVLQYETSPQENGRATRTSFS